MILTDDEKKMLDGVYGEGIQKSFKLLVQWGELFGADKMVESKLVHLSTNFPTEAIVEMTKGSEKTRTFCTTHAVFDPKYWRERFKIVVEELAGGYVTTDEIKFVERIDLLKRLGFLPTFTCSPYTIGIIPQPGDVLCMTGSSGQVISNSFFRARAGRESVSTCFATAVVGKTPLMGLLKKENRYAEVLVKIGDDLDPENFTEADYGALGYYVGGVAGSRNVAIEGLPSDMTFEHGRMLVSPLPVSGACVMCHIVGVTPEANTLEEALGGKKPEIILTGKRELSEAYEKLNSSSNSELDMVVIGCPHLTIKEIREMASLIEGRKVKANVRFVVGVAEPIYTLAERCGYTKIIEEAGGFFVNSCISVLNPFIFVKNNARVAATNSARAAHYIERSSGGKTKSLYGDMKKCVQAAIKGRWEE